jgi:hypothetical protein
MRAMTAILILITMLIPLMWILGHRANNSLLFFMAVFALFATISRSFSARIEAIVTVVAGSLQKTRMMIAWLIAVEIILIVLHLINNGQTHFWNVNREEGVATLVAALLLAMNVLVISVCWKRYASKADRWKWLLVGALFGAIAIDELSEMHDWIPRYIYHLLGGEGNTISDGFAIWVIVLSPVIITIIVFLVLFFFRVLNRTSQKWALTGLVCWCLVLTVEVLGSKSNIPWLYGVAIEEFLEMLGSTLFLSAFLTQLRRT